MTIEQKKLIKELDFIKNQILLSNDRKEIILLIKETLKQSVLVLPRKIQFADGSEFLDEKGKAMILRLLENEMQDIQNGTYSDIKSIKFQISATIVMLMLQFADVGISDIKNIINKN